VGSADPTDAVFERLVDVRVHHPEEIPAALARRARREHLAPDGVLFLIAADHPARGALAAGGDEMAMADRRELLRRLIRALDNPRVDGVLASADILEDLVLLGALENRVAVGTMNRGGLAGATWELDDRMTAYDPEHLARFGLDGGKMLLRLDDGDAGTASTLESCGRTVTELSDRGLMAMVEPLPYSKDAEGRAVLDRRPGRMVRAAAVASGLGASSAHTWLKIPAGEGVAAVLSASTCPALVLGGAVSTDRRATFSGWAEALAHPHCRGLVIGRALLYPPDGDVAGGVAEAAELVSARARRLAEASAAAAAGDAGFVTSGSGKPLR
jgi:hypothetical protein